MALSKNESGLDLPVPVQDKKRVEGLQSYDILYSVSENEFDALTGLASGICNVPVSLLNFIDKDQQFTKSCTGVSIGHLPRSKSVCQYTIMHDRLFEVTDLAKDPRFKYMPYVEGDPHFRYYAGIPLIADNGHAIGALCVLDYKPNKLTEQQEQDLRVLADEVVARLNLRKREKNLEELNHYKDRLMRVFSHDIRSPLTGIVGAAELLKESELEENEREELADIIMGCAKQIENMGGELLDAEMVQFGKIKHEPSPENISEIIDDLMNQFKFQAKNKDIHLHYKLENQIPKLNIDANIHKRILANLISNAIKFTQRNGEIKIRCQFKLNDCEPDTLITIVEDNGIGMSDEQLENLFNEKEEGGRSGTENEQSYGLGMLIVKRLTEACNGCISADSEVDNGTSFRIEIPTTIAE